MIKFCIIAEATLLNGDKKSGFRAMVQNYMIKIKLRQMLGMKFPDDKT